MPPGPADRSGAVRRWGAWSPGSGRPALDRSRPGDERAGMTEEHGARSDPPPAAGTSAAAPDRWGVLLARPYAPVALALGLAILSSPIVAWSLTLPPEERWVGEVGWVPVDGVSAMLLALAAVIPAALVGGSLGGLVRSRRPVLGAFVAVWISWAIGIVVLPAAATLLGVTLRIGIYCIDVCTVTIRDDNPLSGFDAYGSTLLFGGTFVLPALLGGLLAIAAAVAGRRHALVAGVVLAVLAQGAVHFWSLVKGGLPAWLCLAVGVVIWSAVLPRPAIRPAATLPAPPWAATGWGAPTAAAAPAVEAPAGDEPPAPPAGQPPLPLA